MDCPTCSHELKPVERQGIEIDYCPKCRGVWLDRGELDKIIERSSVLDDAPRSRPAAERRMDDSDYGKGFPAGSGKPYKRESFFSRIFDWD